MGKISIFVLALLACVSPARADVQFSVRLGTGISQSSSDIAAPVPSPCVSMCDAAAYMPEEDDHVSVMGLRVVVPVSDKVGVGVEVSSTELMLLTAVTVQYGITDRLVVDVGAGSARVDFDTRFGDSRDDVPAVTAAVRYKLTDGINLFVQHIATESGEHELTGTYISGYTADARPISGSYPIHASSDLNTTLIGFQIDIN